MSGFSIAGAVSEADPLAFKIANNLSEGTAATIRTNISAASLAANTFTATQTITLASANTGVLASTGYSLTGSNATSMASLAGTVNTSGNVNVIDLDLTTTALGSTSNLLRLRTSAAVTASFINCVQNATSMFSVSNAGILASGAYLTAGSAGTFSYVFNDSGGTNGLWFSAKAAGGSVGVRIVNGQDALGFAADTGVVWTTNNGNFYNAAVDTGLHRNAAGVVEVNNGTAGTYRDSKVRDVFTNNASYLIRTDTTITGGATGNVPTITAGPVTGDPTKWIPIDDNGTTRYIPAW